MKRHIAKNGLLRKKEFQVIHLKLSGNCAFSQSFCTRKLGEIAVLYAV